MVIKTQKNNKSPYAANVFFFSFGTIFMSIDL